jgi:phage terminase large subunit-like protein
VVRSEEISIKLIAPQLCGIYANGRSVDGRTETTATDSANLDSRDGWARAFSSNARKRASKASANEFRNSDTQRNAQ